ncbi:PREDICTED: putative gustatory receptor 28b [Wasmannia auropunctata]|uniref:putative gustatory receptor 28b n=1 Tax=Wasmannia auropunctata TaxID=64793 RepID=UPI0005EF569D|nr:PREDICTED: putative gustatory receptor 28b [Wasmannia auropunctata]
MKKLIKRKPRVLTMFYYEQRNSFLIMKLKALMKTHMAISNAVQMLNKTLSLQLLVTIIITFFEINLDMYVYLVQWNNGMVLNLDKQIGELFLSAMVQYITKMVLIVWVCETGKNEAQRIRTTIHDVLNSIRDEKIKNELQLFSLQTLHCKITFSAKGFNVDATFLATMMGTITTYMLISIQFFVTSHSCDGKSAINST